MSVKLRISDPIVISRGPRYKDVGWGTYQEPAIGVGSDGTVYASVKLTEDSGKFYGVKNGHAFFASKDGGESWEDLPIEEWESAAMKRALRLPNGERIRIDLMQYDHPSAHGVFLGYEMPLVYCTLRGWRKKLEQAATF